jgi:hypothetical protein
VKVDNQPKRDVQEGAPAHPGSCCLES